MFLFKCPICGRKAEVFSSTADGYCSKCGVDMLNLGRVDNLKQMRQLAGLSQSAVARALGITKPYVSMLENGKVPVTDEMMDRLNYLYKTYAV